MHATLSKLGTARSMRTVATLLGHGIAILADRHPTFQCLNRTRGLRKRESMLNERCYLATLHQLLQFGVAIRPTNCACATASFAATGSTPYALQPVNWACLCGVMYAPHSVKASDARWNPSLPYASNMMSDFCPDLVKSSSW